MIDYLNYSDLKFEIKRRIKVIYKNQSNFAEVIHVSREWLNKLVNNIDLMNPNTLFDICLKLGIKGIAFN